MYTPHEGDEGMALFLSAFRDYLAADPAITALLPNGRDSIIPEGFLDETTETPVIMPAVIGDAGVTAGITLARLIVYVLDRGRSYYAIEKIIHRVRARLNDSDAAMRFFSFPTEHLQVLHINASGTTSSATYPAWKSEGRGLYVFVELGGLPYSD